MEQLKQPMLCILVSGIIYTGMYMLSYRTLPMFFPFRCIYFTSTFRLSYPGSSVLRSLVFSFFLSFVELYYCLCIISSEGFGYFSVLLIEYALCFLAVTQIIRRDDLVDMYRNLIVRTFLFAMEAFVKGVLIIWAIDHCVGIGLNHMSFLFALAASSFQVLLTPLVHLLDGILCLPIAIRQLDYSGFKIHGKIGLVISTATLVCVGVARKYEKTHFQLSPYEDLFAKDLDWISTLVCISFMTWYVRDAYEFGRYFNRHN